MVLLKKEKKYDQIQLRKKIEWNTIQANKIKTNTIRAVTIIIENELTILQLNLN